MRARSLALGAALLTLSVTLVACGDKGSSGGGGGSTSAGGSGSGGCKSATGNDLVVLTDDKHLQTVDNVIPAISAKAPSRGALIAALNKVSGSLTTQKLITMNKAVDINRETSKNVATAYVKQAGLTTGVSGGSGKIVIGAANFAENQTLGNIYAQVLKAAGFDASVKTVGNRELYEPALEKGDLQVVPEYVGTFTEFLNVKQNGAKASPVASPNLAKTQAGLKKLGKKAGLVFGKASPAADQNSFAVTTAFADANGLKTLSDLASKCNGGDLVLGGPPECPKRPFCQPGLQKKYRMKITGFKALDAGGPLTKTAIKQGKVQLGLVFSSDGSLTG
jgi:osmoprotectant transport system substrate-binding protein